MATSPNTMRYADLESAIQSLRTKARESLKQIERQSAPMNSNQVVIFEKWLDETFTVFNVIQYPASKFDELLEQLLADLKQAQD